ncbi:hypothetical protein EYC80_008222 [Monilinia laxa]|uniref:Uncharacterized protein n=1 Tax=Monilinia laxa TaxID=61186 RepID=A0A5N6JTW4_MONLA|nr:hypothetical protein EYC80_008222 [Monilinia laxa]
MNIFGCNAQVDRLERLRWHHTKWSCSYTHNYDNDHLGGPYIRTGEMKLKILQVFSFLARDNEDGVTRELLVPRLVEQECVIGYLHTKRV